MGLSSVFLCGRGAKAPSGKHLVAECDRPSCSAGIVIAGDEEYRAAAAAGWRRETSTGAVRCPAHADDLTRPQADRHDPACSTLTGECTCAELAQAAARERFEAAARAAGVRR